MSAADVGREARPDPVALLTAAVGSPGEPAGLAPALEDAVRHLGPEGREAALLAALRAVLPVTEQWLVAHGCSPEDAASSVADVDRKIDRYGLDGTGLDWLVQVATGRVVAVGRLQFERATHLPDGTPAWGVHVPEVGPLDPDACDRSFAAAPAVLRRLDPDTTVDTFVCSSWLLDPEVAAVLGPSSNTARFAARFTLLPEPPEPHGPVEEGDDSMAKFVFGTDLASARQAVPSGRLQRAVQERWAAGGHWSERTGTAPVGVPSRT
ncbi:hypothetical protein DEJ24_09320 [Curtobacterium sp. MCPF17_001]|uniref:hypothetical protein n=1 Tax=Curtobacterium sp. MCPF17_001 TaxID=2175651 RepID=UPI000DAACE3D|nr:hypothetical protein [Curtobacterium sp. MCPF17_001]PZE58843.1 hypothetical protein DEJ24_09320 [Curtobacterium sp. MCPF17_001]